MSKEVTNFGAPDYFQPDAIGKPGNRRFRIIARKGRATASLWIEREQLAQLMEFIQQLLVRITGSEVFRSLQEVVTVPPKPRTDFPEAPTMEFQVGPMLLSFDEEEMSIAFLAAPLELIIVDDATVMNPDTPPQFRVVLTPESAERFIEDAEGLLNAGRPRCPYCDKPITTPDELHGCVKLN